VGPGDQCNADEDESKTECVDPVKRVPLPEVYYYVALAGMAPMNTDAVLVMKQIRRLELPPYYGQFKAFVFG
jgi:hypothetical protein